MANEIKLKITIDGKEASASIKLTEEEIQVLTRQIRDSGKASRLAGETTVDAFTNARNVVQGMKETFSLLSMAVGSLINAYGAQEDAEVKLQTVMMQTGDYTKRNFEELKNYASQLQATTRYGDETSIAVMGLFQAMGLNIEQTKAATLQAANLATLMGGDLNSAARIMGDVFAGNGTMINRYIKGLDETILKSGDTAKIIEHLNSRIGGQAEAAAKTGTGAIIQMRNAIGDLSESGGMLLAKTFSPLFVVIKDVTTAINEMHPAVGGVITSGGVLTTILVTLRVTGLLPTIAQIKTMWALMAANPIGLVVAGVATLTSALAILYQMYGNTRENQIKNARAAEDLNQKYIEQRKQTLSLTEEYKKLNQELNNVNISAAEREATETRIKEILRQLRVQYPDLITQTYSYAASMDEVAAATKRANEELDKALKRQIELRKKTEQMEIAKLFDEIENSIPQRSGAEIGMVVGGVASSTEIANKKLKEKFNQLNQDLGSGKKKISEVIDEVNKELDHFLGMKQSPEYALKMSNLLSDLSGKLQEHKKTWEGLKDPVEDTQQKQITTVTKLRDELKKLNDDLVKTDINDKKTLASLTKQIEDKQTQINNILGVSRTSQTNELENLRVELMRGRDKELAELRIWYDDKKKIAAGNNDLLNKLQERYNQRQLEINRAYYRSELQAIQNFTEALKNEIEEQQKARRKMLADKMAGEKPPPINIDPNEGMSAEEIAKKNFQLHLMWIGTTSLEEAWVSAGGAMSNAMGEAVGKLVEGNSILQVFIRSLIQALVQGIALKAMMAALNFATGGIGGLFSSIIGGGGNTLPGAASGAVVTRPTIMMVGEGKEPEGVFPLSWLNRFVGSNRGAPAEQKVNLNLSIEPGELTARGTDMRSVLRLVEQKKKVKR